MASRRAGVLAAVRRDGQARMKRLLVAAVIALPLALVVTPAQAATANVLPSFMSATAGSATITAAWLTSPTAHPGITTYHVQLALADTGQIEGDGRTTRLGWTFTSLTPGTRYQWRLAVGQDPWHLASQWSPWSRNVWTTRAQPAPAMGTAPGPLPLPMGTCGQASAPSSCIPATDYGTEVTPLLTGATIAATWDPSQTFFDSCGQAGHPCSQGTISTDSNGNALLTSSGQPGSNAQLSSSTLGGAGLLYTYGIFEAALYVPRGPDGMADWPAMWMTGTNWPHGGEIDALEGFGCDMTHYFDTNGTGQYASGCLTLKTPGWHDVTLVWEQDYIAVYVDGAQTADFYSPTVAGGPPLMVVFDMATGNQSQTNHVPGQPATLGIGWFRAYEWSGN